MGAYDKASDTFGLYVIEPSVKEDGTLVSIESRGFFITSNGQQEHRLRILVYRETCYNDMYEEFYRNDVIYTNDDNNTYGYIGSDVNVRVQKGDLIAVQTQRMCNDRFCPFQPAIMSNVTTQVMHNQRGDINMLQPLESVSLNVQANITGKCCNLA